MKRALIAIASVGILVTIVGVDAAKAQEGPAPNPGWEWYATVGPVRRSNQCVVDVDNNRGYGFLIGTASCGGAWATRGIAGRPPPAPRSQGRLSMTMRLDEWR